MLGVNVIGPYHQFQDWPLPVPDTTPIVTPMSTVAESANCIANLSNVEWGVKDTPSLPPSTASVATLAPGSTCCTHSRCTAATVTSEYDSHLVPEWAKFGVYKFNPDKVEKHKRALRWDDFKDALDPYWKVGNIIAIWKKIYDLLWPNLAEKCWQLTHAKLINVLQQMIDAVPVDEDGAPDRSLIKMARERYNNSVTNLTTKQVVMVSEKEFLPPSTSRISSGFSGFAPLSTPENMYSQSSKSVSSSGSKK